MGGANITCKGLIDGRAYDARKIFKNSKLRCAVTFSEFVHVFSCELLLTYPRVSDKLQTFPLKG